MTPRTNLPSLAMLLAGCPAHPVGPGAAASAPTRTAGRSRALLSIFLIAPIVGCPAPPEFVTCEEVDACVESTSTGASTSTSADPDSDTHDAGSDTAAGMSSGPGESADASGTSTGPDSTTAPDDTTSGTGDTTTAGGPFCGDGIVNQDAEECDDASPSADGPCSPLCKRERIVFVLSLVLQGKMSGLQGADSYCRSQAFKAQQADLSSPIKDAKNFKALLPSSTETIFSRHFHGEGRYRLINGLTVSDSFAQLFSEPLQNAINVDEFGQTRNTGVWTASTANGQPYPGAHFCNDWTSINGSASSGWSPSTNAEWIEDSVGQPLTDCLDEFALYCVEQR